MRIEELKNTDWILFEVISGSYAYGTNIEGVSDKDSKGVFCYPLDKLLGMDYIEQISDERQDNTFYELKRFFFLLTDKNPSPNLLELLYTPEDCIIQKHPLFDLVLQNRNIFLTKKCKESWGHYAVLQIKKARGLNKRIVQKMERERKTPLDFCYVLDVTGYGTISVTKWLSDNNLQQENCGLTKIPNMRDGYSLFYSESINFKGIIQGNESNELSLSSIPKGVGALGILSFNKDGYSKYCKQYREHWDWDKNKNPHRFNDNMKHGKGYDGKNLAHCHRLLDMAIEIAQGKGVIVRRPNREQLLSIRFGEYDYDQLVSEAEEKIKLMDELFDKSNLPDDVDRNAVNDLLIKMRKQFYKI